MSRYLDMSAHRALASDRAIVSEGVAESVLLVESDQALRETLAAALQLHAFHVIEASTGGEALQILRHLKGTVEWLVTNVCLSGLSGLHVAFEYRFQFPVRPIVFIDSSKSSSDSCLLTCSRWLPEPYSSGQLLRLMEGLRDDKHEPLTMGC